MRKHQLVTLSIWLTLLSVFLLIGCQVLKTSEPSLQVTQSFIIAELTRSPTSISAPIPTKATEATTSAPANPAQAASPTPLLTPTPTPITDPTGTPSPTATAMPFLAIDKPTLAQIEVYLSAVDVANFSIGEGLRFFSLKEYFDKVSLSEYADIYHEDISGDGRLDLVLTDLLPFSWENGILVVMVRSEEGYAYPLAIHDGAKYSPRQHVDFEDWTGDGVPEVIFDFKSDIGGTGYIESTWTRYVIHCAARCEVVWHRQIGQIREGNTTIGLTNVEVERWVDDEGKQRITVMEESFDTPAFRSLRVQASTREEYVWTGHRFEGLERIILSDAYEVETKSILTATGNAGSVATISAESNSDDPYRPIENCQLRIDGNLVGDVFTCYSGFTTVEWTDLNGNGREEVIVKALRYSTQRLLAYTWDESDAKIIADITGDIVSPDLFGVRLEDIDNDGQLEVTAGRLSFSEGIGCKDYEGFYPEPVEFCWKEFVLGTTLYGWNGAEYVNQSVDP